MTTHTHSTALPAIGAAPRYAIYFAPPPGSDAWQAGSAWLGRCAATGQVLRQPEVAGVPAEAFARLTAAPARYGWHATLKAPFTLAEGISQADLERRLASVCAALPAFTLPPLGVARLGAFLALTPDTPSHHLQRVADACVTQLHALAAPLSPSEWARRRGAGLSDRQEVLLQAWGYPHVLEQFRFHFSLTGPLNDMPASVSEALMQAAQSWFASLPPCPFHAVALFVEPVPGQPMQWLGQWPLGGQEVAP
jgi:putative phosphonate metabolism protein